MQTIRQALIAHIARFGRENAWDATEIAERTATALDVFANVLVVDLDGAIGPELAWVFDVFTEGAELEAA